MAEVINIQVEGGTSKTLLTAGKYCNKNIKVTATLNSPTGTLEITENGEYDVTTYEKVNVNVENGGGSGSNEYTLCDFIQFSGNQFVDTGIIGNQDTQINVSFTWENSTQRHLFGCASSDNKKSITSYMNGSWRFGDKSSTKTFSSKNSMLPYSALVNKTTISITNSISNISGVNTFETVGTLLLGGARDSDATLPSVGITGKVFYFIIWENGEKILDLAPAINSNGEYGFLDKISNNFLKSVTSTPLSGGNL